MTHQENFFGKIREISEQIEINVIENIIDGLSELRSRKGRLFFLGVGGSAANCSHAVNDFRKLCGIESYAPTDNVSEFTARINDEGWEGVFVEWLKASNFSTNDGIFILSVGGGNKQKNVSVNLIRAADYAKSIGSKIFGIVGRDGGYTKEIGQYVCLIPDLDSKLVTPLAEAYQAIVWHAIVSDPKLQINPTKW